NLSRFFLHDAPSDVRNFSPEGKTLMAEVINHQILLPLGVSRATSYFLARPFGRSMLTLLSNVIQNPAAYTNPKPASIIVIFRLVRRNMAPKHYTTAQLF